MGCAHAESPIGTCLCACDGAKHGHFSNKPPELAVKCSPAAEKRCKEGNEDGECHCACGGINHGLYKHIANFDSIKINHYVH